MFKKKDVEMFLIRAYFSSYYVMPINLTYRLDLLCQLNINILSSCMFD
jgi:hypothetical protein